MDHMFAATVGLWRTGQSKKTAELASNKTSIFEDLELYFWNAQKNNEKAQRVQAQDDWIFAGIFCAVCVSIFMMIYAYFI